MVNVVYMNFKLLKASSSPFRHGMCQGGRWPCRVTWQQLSSGFLESKHQRQAFSENFWKNTMIFPRICPYSKVQNLLPRHFHFVLQVANKIITIGLGLSGIPHGNLSGAKSWSQKPCKIPMAPCMVDVLPHDSNQPKH